MMAMRQGMFGVSALLVALVCGGCAFDSAESEGEAGKQQASVETYHYRYGKELLEATFDNASGDRVLLEGPDNGRIAELMGQPSTGVATDPTDKTTFWIYTNEAERLQVAEAIGRLIKDMPVQVEPSEKALLVAPPTTTKSLTPPGGTITCSGPYAALYQANNLGGGALTMGPGYIPDLIPWNINDQVSSVFSYGGTVTLYENQNYGGHSLMLNPDIVTRNSLCPTSYWQVNALSNYTMVSRWWWTNISWNDQASSVVFTVY
jgi:hypothetical protein